jgi:hypothetical protein
MNLMHVNVARALLADPEDAILHLTWIRIQFLINLQDVNWSLPAEIKGSTPEALVGCESFLRKKADERYKELRCSRSQSYIQQSECRDMRDILSNTDV